LRYASLSRLSGTRPSGSSGPPRRCQGCFAPSPAPPGSGCPQPHRPAATGRSGGSLTRPGTHSASWRTFTRWNGSATWVAAGSIVSNARRHGPDRSSVAHLILSNHAWSRAASHAQAPAAETARDHVEELPGAHVDDRRRQRLAPPRADPSEQRLVPGRGHRRRRCGRGRRPGRTRTR
jgi:hypothetical protein